MKKLFKNISSSQGFSSVELILGIIISVAITMVSIQTISSHTDAFNFVAARKTAVADVRFAVAKITAEFEKIGDGDITDIQASEFTYTNSAEGPVTYRLFNNNLLRNNDLLLKKVDALVFRYFQLNGSPLTPTSNNIPDVKRIKVTIKTLPSTDEGSIVMAAYVVPRRFLGYLLQ
ncbi:MAG: hypothetical protein ABII18_07755 [bacterium]|nr:hypothetical protein [bacterium]MBU1918440.1 hypothetical protein [bacterium]